MTENDSSRSVRARSIRGAVIMTGDGNSLGAYHDCLDAVLERPDPAAAAPPPAEQAASVAKQVNQALETAKQAEEFTAHAAVVAERVGAVCRWLGRNGAALLALLGRSSP